MKDINGKEIKEGQIVKHDCIHGDGWLVGEYQVIKLNNRLCIGGIHGIQTVKYYLEIAKSKIEVI